MNDRAGRRLWRWLWSSVDATEAHRCPECGEMVRIASLSSAGSKRIGIRLRPNDVELRAACPVHGPGRAGPG